MKTITGRDIRVLVMDDAVFERQRLVSFLGRQPGISAVGSSVSIADARSTLQVGTHDVVVVSPHHLDPSAVSTVRAIRALSRTTRVIVLAGCPRERCGAECAAAAGADACLPERGNHRRVLEVLAQWFWRTPISLH